MKLKELEEKGATLQKERSELLKAREAGDYFGSEEKRTKGILVGVGFLFNNFRGKSHHRSQGYQGCLA